MEFFAGGNVILTDKELKISTLLRNVPEGEGQEPQGPGLTYSLEKRQNYGGVPDLTKERVRDALQTTVNKAIDSAAAGKKIKKKPGDELRKGLATTITELPPILVDHVMKVTGFDSTVQPSAVLENEGLLDHLLLSLGEGRKIVQEVTSSDACKGYILAKTRPGAEIASSEGVDGEQQQKKTNLIYEDFHPFLPRQFEQDPNYTVLPFEIFNKLVDEFFSSIEGQKLESRLTEREANAKRKLDATKAEHAKRIEGLQVVQQINIRKANAIEANAERVREAMDAVNGLIQQGMDWEDIGNLVDRERRRNNPVAAIIVPPLKLYENTITVLLGEEDEGVEDDDDNASDTDSVASDDSGYAATEASAKNAQEIRLSVDINLGLSPYANAREYYGERKMAAVKEQKTVLQSDMALKSAEQKISAELKKGLKQEKPILQPIRKQLWFEKFTWFISSDGYLVLGGKDAQQNEMLYRRYLKKGDVYVHADLHGAPSVIIKNSPSTPDAPIPPSTLSQAGSLAVCASSAWDSKAGMGAWWVNADQVSKSAPTGEFLGTGSFMVRGKKNFLPPAQLLLGLGLMFRISEESKAKHIKHRLYDLPESVSGKDAAKSAPGETTLNTREEINAEHDESDSEDSATDMEEDAERKENPLQPTDRNDDEYESPEQIESPPIQSVKDLTIAEESSVTNPSEPTRTRENELGDDKEDEDPEVTTEADSTTANSLAPGPSGKSTPQNQKKGQQSKRGQRGKAKKMAKYKDQDEEDRAAIEALIGAAAGKQKAEAEAKAKAEREAQRAAASERRRAQQQRQQRETAEHEEIRKMMLEEGIETLDAEEAASLTPLDSLVGTPLPGDEILEAVVVCAPYNALGRCKYKVKLQPGTQKKGKAVKEVLEAWKSASTKKGVVDEKSEDKEKMWPREVELFKALKPEEVINVVPVGKLRVMMAGGAGGSGGDAKGKSNKGAANRGKKK